MKKQRVEYGQPWMDPTKLSLAPSNAKLIKPFFVTFLCLVLSPKLYFRFENKQSKSFINHVLLLPTQPF